MTKRVKQLEDDVCKLSKQKKASKKEQETLRQKYDEIYAEYRLVEMQKYKVVLQRDIKAK